jgi:hypothetical protein
MIGAALGLPDNSGMVTRVAYDERSYRSADECLVAIREHLEVGWNVVQLRGSGAGPFLVLFRKDENEQAA